MAELERKTLNEWRKQRDLTVEELSKRTKIDQFILGNWLYKGRTPRVPAAVTLAEVLNVEVSQIIWGKVEKEDKQPTNLLPMPKSPDFTPTTKAILVSDEQMAVAQQWLAANVSKTAIAEAMGVSRQTFYAALKRFEEQQDIPAVKKSKTRKGHGD